MKDKICNLIDVKSIITISFTILFMVLAIKGVIDPREVVTIYSVIISFYFGTQYQKKINETQKNDTSKISDNVQK
jgi:hypothetical protein